MQFMLLVCCDRSFRPTAELEPETNAWVEEMDRRGVRKQGDRFRSINDAKTVMIRDGKAEIAAGPFEKTDFLVAGYDLLECANLDEAVAIALKHPMAKWGKIEVRPIWSE